MKNFICISNLFWDEKWERMQQVSLRLSSNAKVLYLEPVISIKDFRHFLKYVLSLFIPIKFVREIKESLYACPLVAVLPFGRNHIIRGINNFFIVRSTKKVLKYLNMEGSILLIWDFWEADNFIGKIKESLVALDYYDNYIAFHNYTEKEKEDVSKVLQRVFRKSNIVFATSSQLLEEAKKYNPNAYLVPNGVDIKSYFMCENNAYNDIKIVPRPIIGYVGGGRYETCGKLDYNLLLFLTSKLTNFSFVFLGPIGEENPRHESLSILRKRKNVYFLGKKSPNDVPFYLRRFNVCTLPWEINDYTRYIYPLKLNEYLACGKPVISTRLPEMLHFEANNTHAVKIATNYEDFASKIEEAIKEDNPEFEQVRVEIARKNSWDRRINDIMMYIEKELSTLGEKRN